MRHKREPAKYTMELTENQMKVIFTALEEYMRLRLNQWIDLSNDLAQMGVDMSRDNPNHEKIFDDYIERRDTVNEKFKDIGRYLWKSGVPRKSEWQLIAEDIWQTIKHQQWKDRGADPNDYSGSCPPINFGPEPLPIIERIDKE